MFLPKIISNFVKNNNMVSIIIAVGLLIILAVGVFSSVDNRQLTEYELYGMSSEDYERERTYPKEYNRGYKDAKQSVEIDKFDALTLLNQCRNSLTNDDYDKGWKDFCKYHLEIK